MSRARTGLLGTTLLVSALTLGLAPLAPSLLASQAYAQQRAEVREEFRVALEPHGRFERHERYGEVWRPARVARDWRPYSVGRWVYTDDLGWYWNSDQSEADWGWVAFHYGRWIDDRQMGWVWVPGDEWGPAWVNWRRGEGPAVAARGGRAGADVRYIGWAPLPPDDIVDEYSDNPDVWMFVRARDIVAPRLNTVIIRERRPEFLQRSVIVNRTVVVSGRGVIVNPGISPAYVAAFVGRPIVSYDVRPRVIVGTTRFTNVTEVRVDDMRDRRRFQRERPVIRETRTRIEPARDIPPPRALEAKERGRLGDRPPRAAAEGAQDRLPKGTAGDRRGPDQRGPLAPGERPSTTTQDRRDSAPGRAQTAPGRAGEPPGQAGTAPGRQERSTTDTRTTAQPGRSGAAPGRNEATPGQAQTAPGRSGDTPGQSGARPPGQAGTAPGRSADTPAPAQPERGQQQERGARQREERTQPQQPRQERAAEPRGNRGEPTGATPNRGGANERATQPERGAREQRPAQRPEPSERGREREAQ